MSLPSSLVFEVLTCHCFQLTAEAEIKVVQSRELLDTIVKENKGMNTVAGSNGGQILQN